MFLNNSVICFLPKALVSSFPHVLFGFYYQSIESLKILVTKLNHHWICRGPDRTEWCYWEKLLDTPEYSVISKKQISKYSLHLWATCCDPQIWLTSEKKKEMEFSGIMRQQQAHYCSGHVLSQPKFKPIATWHRVSIQYILFPAPQLPSSLHASCIILNENNLKICLILAFYRCNIGAQNIALFQYV